MKWIVPLALCGLVVVWVLPRGEREEYAGGEEPLRSIPYGAFVHAVREDPNRDGLLYAGTNRGVYISYNDGDRWQPLNPGLPDLPIIDIIVEENELVAGSHGRGFWVLDNMAPLREAMPGMTDETKLFTPATATRSAGSSWSPRLGARAAPPRTGP